MDLDGARVLVDPEAVRQRVARAPAVRGHRLEGGHVEALWVKPGRHFNACYRFNDGAVRDGGVIVSGFAVGAQGAGRILSKLGPHRCLGGRRNCAPCSTFAADPGLLFQFFPLDYRLPTLPDCLDARRAGEAIAGGGGVAACELAGYRPGMRCQIRYRMMSGAVVYGKVAVEREPGRAFRQIERVRAALAPAGVAIQLPKPLRYLPELRLTLIESAPGESLHRALRLGGDVGGALRQAAAALADLHRLEIAGVERVYGPADELSLVHGWVELVGALFPDLAEALLAAEKELVGAQPREEQSRAIVHRDFYDKQVLIDQAGVTLLDMDTTCRGDPEIDLGNFCAHFQLRGRQWDRLSELGALETLFLGAYPGPFRAERVGWYRSATLLRLACVYALRPHWRHVAGGLAEEAMRPWRA